jgi:hypothetical protein
MSGTKQSSNSEIFNPDLHSEPSIYIPFVFPNIYNRPGFIKKTIEELGLGEVANIKNLEMKHMNGRSYFRVFVHMKTWANNQNAMNVRSRLLNGDEVKITYDEPWHWFLHKVIVDFDINGNQDNEHMVHSNVDQSILEEGSDLPLLEPQFTAAETLALRRNSSFPAL